MGPATQADRYTGPCLISARPWALPLSCLAAHAQGAPLIRRAPQPPPPARKSQPPPPPTSPQQPPGLPRIIKPRKRRKKDRGRPAQLPEPLDDPRVAVVEEPGAADDSPPSSCSCRYCDPAGLVWDVGQPRYSPSLTTPPSAAEVRVSAEIVSSHDGRRDLEIRFLPPETATRRPATPLDQLPTWDMWESGRLRLFAEE